MTQATPIHGFAPRRWLGVAAGVLLAHGLLAWVVQSWSTPSPWLAANEHPIEAQVLIDTTDARLSASRPSPRDPAKPTPAPAATPPQRTPTPAAPTPAPAPTASSSSSNPPNQENAAAAAAAAAPSTPRAASTRAPEPALVLPSADAAYLQNPPPAYPRMSRRLGEQGTVLLRVLINAQGLPERVELRTSSGYARLDQSALDAVPRWRFVPGQRNGTPEAMWFNVPVRFVLE